MPKRARMTHQKIRIFIASPGDVMLERDKVKFVADELCRSGNAADKLGVTLEVLDWRTHVAPAMGRPEAEILKQLDVESWDIFVGIMWQRFGTATGAKSKAAGAAYESGTEEEFDVAYQLWREQERPRIMFYRCNRPVPPAAMNLQQMTRVAGFFEQFFPDGEHPGLYTLYDEVEDFERTLRNDLIQVLPELVGQKSEGKPAKPKRPKKTPSTSAALSDYLDFVYEEHGRLRLFGFLSRANIDVGTTDVFVSLRFADPAREMHAAHISHDPARPAQVLERAIQDGRPLLILGGPGYGKTTLMKYYAVCCRTPEGREKIGLKRALIPVLISLRQIDPEKPFLKVLAAWAQDHKQRVTQAIFKQWLKKPGLLLLLDGLDEVSDVKTRQSICRRIDEAIADFQESTFVVTCRFTGYHELREHQLRSNVLQYDVMPLDAAQQRTFFEQWFNAATLANLQAHEIENPQTKRQTDEKARSDAAHVFEHLEKEENESLRELARVPVLLQIIAIIWREQGQSGLSGRRVDLYSRSINYLLDHRDAQKGIPKVLPADQARLVLRPLALWMQEVHHKDEAPGKEIAAQIAKELEVVAPGLSPTDFLDNIRDRAGVLVGSGAETYTFQHKSFREFLAAIEIANQGKAQLLVENFQDPWWRDTVLFAAGITSPVVFPDFLKAFLPHKHNSGPTSPLLLQVMREAAVRPLAPFAQAIADRKLGEDNRYNATRCLEFIPSNDAITLLQGLADRDKHAATRDLASGILAGWQGRGLAPELLEAERVAGRDRDRFHNPHELNAEYIFIEGGEFKYSGTKKQTKVAPFCLAKYPVTNKLYRRFHAFLAGKREETKLSLEKFAQSLLEMTDVKKFEGLAAHLERDSRQWAQKLQSAYVDDGRFNNPDQPVVGVTWYAAATYCHWLTLLAAADPYTAARREFRLPREKEWEWAAGGGERRFPWGSPKPDNTRANYTSEIGQTTPVGAYPEGATPEGLMDMAGNVWEWNENLYGKGGYSKESRALRGGSWLLTADFLRCSARFNYDPYGGWSGDGFRVLCVQS